MKTLTFYFDHPVAVKVFLSCTSNKEHRYAIQFIRSDETGLLTIPVHDVPDGTWLLNMEWSFDEREYCMEKTIKMPEGTVL
ncbi:hypothetical protein [Pedobacter antarcticus]|uniref:Uncharacterized protein n=2 Tax=Pedobacter antarcticus TaxID=34086 RepID=A0A081PI69_9SPHI|nr:hypothetical protein [Pedobacter antarcticus]KEQ30392.1 hypothetical protein N180_16550 [Pedobacter antarcticus 4BY]SDL81508.1 hypothetical protein SAMN04488084_102546 [Pedobacter antarcticus]SFF02045.1 hypothetical protein SAMN03003324_02116 [Pedobacter antarcticus]